MKKATLAGLAVRCAVFYFTLGGICHSLWAQSEVKFRQAEKTVIVVSLTANNQGPFDFVLDTGTDTCIVEPELARQLSLVALDRLEMHTFARTQMLVRSSIGVLAAGSAHAENVEVLIQDLPELRRIDSHLRGIVGQNFLSHWNYLLDYHRHTLRFEMANEIELAIEGERVPIDTRENKMLVASEAQAQGRARLRLLLDSGTNSVILMPKASQAIDPSSQAWLTAANGLQAGMKTGRVRELMVGSQQFHDLAVGVATPSAGYEGRIEDGLLPTALFQSLYVNNHENFVVFNPRMKKN
jgi:hypothetical protein